MAKARVANMGGNQQIMVVPRDYGCQFVFSDKANEADVLFSLDKAGINKLIEVCEWGRSHLIENRERLNLEESSQE